MSEPSWKPLTSHITETKGRPIETKQSHALQQALSQTPELDTVTSVTALLAILSVKDTHAHLVARRIVRTWLRTSRLSDLAFATLCKTKQFHVQAWKAGCTLLPSCQIIDTCCLLHLLTALEEYRTVIESHENPSSIRARL